MDEAIRQFSRLELAGYIQKPYRLDTLLKAVKGAIDGDDDPSQP